MSDCCRYVEPALWNDLVMATALVHLIGTTALHGALREVADEVAHHGYIFLFVLIAAESFAFPCRAR